jgi:hypothetical protein
MELPILECIHIIGFAMSIGTSVDFRMRNVGMVHQTAQLLKDASAWTLVGIVIMIFSGLLLFSSDPDMYYLNWAFLIKMVCLLLAIVFNYTIHGYIDPPLEKLHAQSTPTPNLGAQQSTRRQGPGSGRDVCHAQNQ